MQAPRSLKTGDVLHIPGTGPNHDRDRGHFHVLLADRDDGRAVLLVPISGAHERCDKTCLISIGDHDCISKDSFILYSKMNYYSMAHLEQRIASGSIELLSPASKELTKKISDGVLTSSFASPTYRKCIKEYRERQVAAAVIATA